MKRIFQTMMFAPLFLLIAISASAEDRVAIEGGQNVATLRDGPIDREVTPPPISRIEDSGVKRKRAYPMQPPTIPHKINGYQVDLKVNKCLACHSRKLSEDSQAPMVSVTHYMDRQGNFLADVSPRRYFCEQCHVTQSEAPVLIVNEFIDIDQLLGLEEPAGN